MKRIFDYFRLAILALAVVVGFAAASCERSEELKQFSITILDDGNGTGEAMVDGSVAEAAVVGSKVAMTATPAEDYLFDKWVVISGNVVLSNPTDNPATFTMPESDVEIKAQFVVVPAPVEYSISVTNDGNGSAEIKVDGIASNVAVSGSEVTMTAIPAENYMFEKWAAVSGDVVLSSEADNPATFTMPAEDVEIRAEFVDGMSPFTDPAFRYYCAQFDLDRNGTISPEEAAAVSEINVSERGVESLAGIELFTNLEILVCYSNALTSLDPSNNRALNELYCGSNDITNLDLSNNTKLRILECADNNLTNLNIGNNTVLSYLFCFNNNLTNLDVGRSTSLGYLDCHNNSLTSLDLSKNRSLVELYCDSNDLTSLIICNYCPSSSIIYCDDNQLSVEALKDLFVSLPIGVGEAYLDCSTNPGSNLLSAEDLKVAENKGWDVYHIFTR